MGALKTILVIVEVLCSIALIAVVLFQSGKESGLSGVISGGNTDTYLGKSKAGTLDKKLASLTKWIALGWGVLTLLLCVLNAI